MNRFLTWLWGCRPMTHNRCARLRWDDLEFNDGRFRRIASSLGDANARVRTAERALESEISFNKGARHQIDYLTSIAFPAGEIIRVHPGPVSEPVMPSPSTPESHTPAPAPQSQSPSSP